MNDKFIIENQEACNYKCDPTIIFDASLLQYLASYRPSGTFSEDITEEWYPCTNSYYQFAEDYDAVSRVPHLLHEKELLLKEPNCDPKINEKDPFTDYHVSLKYLRSKPVCFIILGKPDIGETTFAKSLANYWKCIYIHPLDLIQEEIESGSRAGLCIDFNLRNGKSIGIDIILRLLQKKLNDVMVQSRGFILCGFPLVPNEIFSENKISSESAIFNAQEIFDDIFDTSLNLDERKNVSRASPSESREDLKPKESTICYDSSYYIESKDQIDFIFKLLKEFFYIIIYMKCENDEVVNIHENNYRDSSSYECVNLTQEKADLSVNFYSEYSNELSSTKLLKLLLDYPTYVKSQLALYQYEFETAIEKYILLHNPEYIIRIDARMSPHKLFQVVKLRLRLLPISKPIIPKKLFEDNIEEEQGEDLTSPQSIINFDNNSPEEWYNTLKSQKTSGPLYKWHLSNWGYHCPVAMFDGKNVVGNPKLAVQFSRNIFFLSSEESLDKFIKNPKPFLLPPFPKPYRKFFILGPKFCGKSAVAKTISYALGGKVLYSNDVLNEFIANNRKNLLKVSETNFRLEGLKLLKEKRQEEYNTAEEERKIKVVEFGEELRELLKQYLNCSRIVNDFDEIEVTALPAPRYRAKSKELMECEKTILEVNAKFREINFPIDDVKLYEQLLESDFNVEPYLPSDLKLPSEFHFDDVSLDDPFIESYTRNALLTDEGSFAEMQLNLDDLVKSYKEAIEVAEEMKMNMWIIDSLPADIQFIEKFLNEAEADLIIILKDSSPNFEYLQEIYENGIPSEIKNHQDFFLKHGDTQAASNLNKDEIIKPSAKSPILAEEDNSEYFKKLQENYEKIMNYLKTNDIRYFECALTNRTIEDVCDEIMDEIRGLNSYVANRLGPEDEMQDMIDLGGHHFEEEEPGEGDEDDRNTKDAIEENRRLGDINMYCPISYCDYGILWKGKKDLAARYKHKTNYFSSEEALYKFLDQPWKYELKSYPLIFPPLRICVAGVKKSGKTTLAQAISNELGLIYINFETKILEILDIDYIEKYSTTGEVSEDILKKILFPLWFNEPAKSIGFVIDDFPRYSHQISFLCSNYLVPEVILYLECNQELLNEKILQSLLDEWKSQIEKEMFVDKANYEVEKHIWEVNRTKRAQELIEEKKEMRYNQRVSFKKTDDGEGDGAISVRSIEEAEDLKEIENILNREFHQPVLNANWETYEEAKMRLQSTVEIQSSENPNFNNVKDECDREIITWVRLDGNKNVNNILNQALVKLIPLKYRSESLFERLYDISIDLAEKLLDDGYCFLSRFGRTCPVQLYENRNLMPMFSAFDNRKQLFPILHRNFIYFIAGAESRQKFKQNFMRYINQENSYLPLSLVRLSIIGPPKSGKTQLCERFQYEYGLKHVSIGQSIRYVLKYLSKSVLGRKVDEILRNGDNLPNDLVIKCVEALSFENVSTGVVMDGIPKTLDEIKGLAKFNLLPHLIIQLRCEEDYKIVGKNDEYKFEYSDKLIFNRFLEWSKSISYFKNWVLQEYQNITRVLTTPSKWKTWSISNDLFLDLVSRIKLYYKSINKGVAMRVGSMLVTPYEFLTRQSSFKGYCPCCLYYDNKLSFGGNPPDRSGLLQYKFYFYWLCSDHILKFIENPDAFLGDNAKNPLPTVLPTKISLEEIPENIFENGDCGVCLKDGLRTKGELKLAAEFAGKVYVFDKQECLEKFLSFPFDYTVVKDELGYDHLPKLELNDLPVLGYLEQFDSNQVIKAIVTTNSFRPLIPGLDLSKSALICIGLVLKINNASTSERSRRLYNLSKDGVFETRVNLINCLERMKKTINPYINYTEREPSKVPKKPKKSSSSSSLSETDTEDTLDEVDSKISEYVLIN